MHTRPNASTLAQWLPSRGSVLFTLIVAAGMLIYAHRAGAFPASQTRTPSSSTNTLPYQGRLTDAKGAPLNGTYSMSFQLYNTASGGTALWTEEWDFADSVVVTNGLFNVVLGSLTPIPQSVITGNSSLWLGISIETDSEMTPRVQVGSVPFAFLADRAYGLTAADGDPQDAVFVDANGNVGVGTTSPGTLFNIVGNIGGEIARFQPATSPYNSRGYISLYTTNPNFWWEVSNQDPAGGGSLNDLAFREGSGSSSIERVYFEGGGNVGIGTANPENLLHVKGPAVQLKIDGSGSGSSAQFALVDAQSNGQEWRLVAGQNNSGGIQFYNASNGVQAMEISTLGDVGIGTTSPNAKLEIWGSSQPLLDLVMIGGSPETSLLRLWPDAGASQPIMAVNRNGLVGFGLSSPQYPIHMSSGAYVSGGGVWTNASDRNLKENFASIDALSLLEKVAQLPLSIWNYKTEGSEISHIGPMAQDFYAAFGVGEDDQHIGTVDANGVALAAIQGLYQLTQDQQTEIETQQETLTQLTTDNAALQDQVAGLEERLAALEEAVQAGQPVQAGGMGRSAWWGMLLLGAVGAGVWGARVSKRRGIPQSPG